MGITRNTMKDKYGKVSIQNIQYRPEEDIEEGRNWYYLRSRYSIRYEYEEVVKNILSYVIT